MRFALSAVLLLFATAARAQSPAERVLIARWDDSVSAIADATALDQFASHPSHASTGANDLRIAMVQLRRAVLTHDRQLTELALIRLDAVAHSHADWPWPEFLMARTLYALSDAGTEFKASSGVRDGEQYIDAAMRHLAEALKADAGMREARQLALDVLVPEGDRELRAPEVAMLRTLLVRHDPEADALLVEGRRLRTALKYDSALAFFDRSLAAGGDKSRLQLERARTMQALHDSTGASNAYWRGLEQLTLTGRESYHHDLAWVLSPDTLAQFDRLPLDSTGSWLRDFWLRRDAEAANYPGERLIEHFRRWNYAFAHFRVVDPWRHNEFKRVEYGFEGFDQCVGNDSSLYSLLNRSQPAHPNDLRRREPLLDHRGLIYLHHGAPYRVVYNPGTDAELAGFALTNPPPARITEAYETGKRPESPNDKCILNGLDSASAAGPNESWLYWIGGGWRVVNFRGSCALGLDQPTTLTSYLPVTDGSPSALAAWAARADLTPDYTAAAYQLLQEHFYTPRSCWDRVTPMIRVSRTDADVATKTDSHTPFVPRPWNAVIQAFGLGSGADRTGEALVTFAIPFDSLHSTRHDDGSRTYEIAARIVGYDHNTGQTFAVDTVRRIPAPREFVGPKGHLAGFFEFALDPGDWQIAVRMRQPGDSIGAYSLLPHVQIDAAAPLTLSDIVTGAANGSAWPAPDGAPFPVAVLGAWPVGGVADVYYEVRGLKTGDDYQTVVTVKDPEATGPEAVRLQATDRATGATSPIRKSIGLAQLKPGTYRLTVTVTHAGNTATRSRDLLIVKP